MNELQGITTEYDLRYFQAGLIDLEGYLLSQELYWPVGANPPAGGPPYPRMTLGNLLLSRARLKARLLPSGEAAEFSKLESRLEETRTRWRVAWSTKAQREFQNRLKLWGDYLEEYRNAPSSNSDRYAYEVSRRVILELLHPEAETISEAESKMLSGLDGLLKVVFVPGPFIWDHDIEASFPASTYWYLYGKPKK